MRRRAFLSTAVIGTICSSRFATTADSDSGDNSGESSADWEKDKLILAKSLRELGFAVADGTNGALKCQFNHVTGRTYGDKTFSRYKVCDEWRPNVAKVYTALRFSASSSGPVYITHKAIDQVNFLSRLNDRGGSFTILPGGRVLGLPER